MVFLLSQTLKKKMRDGILTTGSWITIGDTIVGEVMANRNFDWLVIDMEHSSLEFRDVQRLIQVIQLKNVSALIRIGENTEYTIKRALDTGADGIIVPMINSSEEAIKVVKSMHYPPLGNRGVGLSRAQGYGFNFNDYKKRLKNDIVFIAQVEHINSIENLSEILQVSGLDGTMIGPYDLSASLGVPGEFDNPDFLNSIKSYEKLCKKYNKISGAHIVHPTNENIDYHLNNGYNFLAIGIDTIFLGEGCNTILKDINERINIGVE